MHLCRSFSQRRKSSKQPRDLHIRKVSLSGCSLSSESSISSTPSSASSSSTARAPMSARSAIFDPLSLHPTATAGEPHPQSSPSLSPSLSPSASRSPSHSPSTPPPRLHDRPMLASPERPGFDESATFFYDTDDTDDDDRDVTEDDYFGHRYAHGSVYSYGSGSGYDPDCDCDCDCSLDQKQSPLAMPTMDHTGYDMADCPFTRPQLPRSRWSASTIETLDSLTEPDDEDDNVIVDGLDGAAQHQQGPGQDEEPLQEQCPEPCVQQQLHYSMPNFSYKRATVPRRPPVKTLDGLEDLIKRGGWKRRGIVFQNDKDSGI